MIKKLFSHTAIYGIAPHIPKLVSFFTLPIITKYLDETDFGVYGVMTALVAAISIFSTLGLNVTLSNIFYKSPNYYKFAWRQVYGFLMMWNIIYGVILGLVIWAVVPDEARENTIMIILANVLPVILFGPTSIIGSLYYQLRQKPFQIAIRSAVFGIIGVLLTLLFIAHLRMGYMGWFWSAAITQILLQASYWYPLNIKQGFKPIFNFKRRFIKRQLKIGMPTVPHYYGAYLLNTSDRLLMKFLNVPIDHIGMYNAANTISNFIGTAGIATGQAVGPMLLQSYKDKNEKLGRKLIFILQILFLAGCFSIAIWLKEIFSFLIKNDVLASTYPLGIILVMAYAYRPMYLGANNRLFYYEKTAKLPLVTFVAGVLTLILNLVFIPIYGYQVAAYTTFFGLMYMGYSGYFLKDFKETNTINFYPIFWLVTTIILTIIGYIVVELDVVIKIIINIFALIIGLIALRKIK